MSDWHTIDTAPADELVMTKIDDEKGVRNEQPMLRRGNLWWINVGKPGEMYAYYTPTHWMRMKSSEAEPATALPAAIIRVKIEEGGTGLLYATSPDLHGLLVAERDMDALEKTVPQAIAALYAAQDIKVALIRATGADAPFAWVAIPAETAQRLGADE